MADRFLQFFNEQENGAQYADAACDEEGGQYQAEDEGVEDKDN